MSILHPLPSSVELASPPPNGKVAFPPAAAPGFALPEAVLHSIPLPAEFDRLVRAAIDENHVVSPLPKYFNPVFRRQGVVNKHLIRALESVGQSLSQLAREIEGRDRVLEKLASHLNSHGEHVHRGQVALAHMSEELGGQLSQLAEHLEKRHAQDLEASLVRTDSLLAKARSTDQRLGELQSVAADLTRRLQEYKDHAEQKLADAQAAVTTALGEHGRIAGEQEASIAQIRTQLEAMDRKWQESAAALEERSLAKAAEGIASLQKELADHVSGFAQLQEDTGHSLKDILEKWTALSVGVGAQREQLDAIEKRFAAANDAMEKARLEGAAGLATETQRLEGQLAESAQKIEAIAADAHGIESRLAEMQTQAGAEKAVADAALAALEKRLEGQLGELRSFSSGLADQIRSDVAVALQGAIQRMGEETAKANEALQREQTAHRSEISQGVGAWESRVAGLEEQVARFVAGMSALQNTGTEGHAAFEKRLAALEASLQAIETATRSRSERASIRDDSLTSSIRAATQGLAALAADYAVVRADLSDLAEVTAKLSKRQDTSEAALAGPAAEFSALLPALQSRLEALQTPGNVAKRRAIAKDAQPVVQAAQEIEADGFYVALEARFRGPRSLVRERQAKYLPVIEEARNRVDMFPPQAKILSGGKDPRQAKLHGGVLDLGCGRGEWLRLLKERGVPALGVDRNRFFLQACRERECDVAEADIMEFLKHVPDQSVAAVTSFHVIEHLPIPTFQEMARQVFRVLRRGGIAIFETPNPGNVLTSSLNFLLDPTHLRPVHPELGRLMLEMSGFSSVRLEFMSPYEKSHHVGQETDSLAQRFNQYFYGPQDYAIIGAKP